MVALLPWYTAVFFGCPPWDEKNGNGNPSVIAVFRLSYHIFGEM